MILIQGSLWQIVLFQGIVYLCVFIELYSRDNNLVWIDICPWILTKTTLNLSRTILFVFLIESIFSVILYELVCTDTLISCWYSFPYEWCEWFSFQGFWVENCWKDMHVLLMLFSMQYIPLLPYVSIQCYILAPYMPIGLCHIIESNEFIRTMCVNRQQCRYNLDTVR